MLESKIQSDIIKKLTDNGWFVVKIIQSNMNGIPDLMALKKGKAVFVEVKQPGKKPTPLQEHRLVQLQRKGVEAFVASSVEEVEHLFFSPDC